MFFSVSLYLTFRRNHSGTDLLIMPLFVFPSVYLLLAAYQEEVKFQLPEAATRSCFGKEVFKNFVEFTEKEFLF